MTRIHNVRIDGDDRVYLLVGKIISEKNLIKSRFNLFSRTSTKFQKSMS